MKKFVLLIIMFVMPLMVLGKEYTFDEIGVKITIDDDFYVFTRDNYQNNETLKELGITEDYMYNYFYNNKAYIDVVPKSFAYEIVVNVAIDNLDMTNLSNYPDGMIGDLSKEILKKMPTAKCSIYNNGKYKFLNISFFDSASGTYIYRYYTIFDNRGLSFHIQKNSEVIEEEKEILKKLVDTIEFDSANHNTRENAEMQKEIDEYGKSKFNWKRLIIRTIIGGIVGALGALVLKLKKNKKDESTGI